MNWFNLYGLIILTVMMIPNVIDAKLHPEHFENLFQNKALEILEQVGRFGSFLLMVVNIPRLCSGFWIENGQIIYIAVNAVLLTIYILGWVILRSRMAVFRAYLLSVTPSAIFLFSGIMLAYGPLIVLSILFAICHITISVKNAKLSAQGCKP